LGLSKARINLLLEENATLLLMEEVSTAPAEKLLRPMGISFVLVDIIGMHSGEPAAE